jgi:hypothetical protein
MSFHAAEKPFSWWGSVFTPFKVGTLLAAVALGAYTEHMRLPQYLLEVSFDEFARNNLAPTDDRIVLIDIDDESYREDFHSESPMSPDVVRKLIQFAVDNKAVVIGVDIDTSHWGRECNRLDHQPLDVRIICGSVNADAVGYLGISAVRVDEPHVRNETGIVRTHPAFGPGGRLSFSDALVDRYCNPAELPGGTTMPLRLSDCPLKEKLAETIGQSRYISFVERQPCPPGSVCRSSPRFARFPAGKLLRPPKGTPPPDDLFFNKIVLIGGTAEAFRDDHESPFGPESGLELHAEMVASRLHGGVSPLSKWTTIGLDLFTGVLILFLQGLAVRRFAVRTGRPSLKEPLELLVIIAAALTVGYLAYLSFWIAQINYSFMVVLLSLLVGDWIEARLHKMYPELSAKGWTAWSVWRGSWWRWRLQQALALLRS